MEAKLDPTSFWWWMVKCLMGIHWDRDWFEWVRKLPWSAVRERSAELVKEWDDLI
jgi:hypothetical protein